MTTYITKTGTSKSVPSSPTYNSVKSDRWLQEELAVASRNAEKNRSIKVAENSKIRANNADKKAVSPPASFLHHTVAFSETPVIRRTASAPTTKDEHDEIRKVETSPGPDALQSSIHNIIDEWSNAVKSLFSEHRAPAANLDPRHIDLNMLVLL